MITVRVQNFQSIIDETIEIDGFTAITGQNNVGKTAFLRAIRGLFCNARGTSFVRANTDYCTVTITFEDGTTVSWQKGKGKNRYRINDQDWLKKVGAGVPDEVVEVLNVNSISAGTAVLWPQFNTASENLFLLNKPGSVMAEAISDVERVGLLNRSLKLAESDHRKVRSTLRVRREDKKGLEDRLTDFEGLDEIGSRIGNIEKLEGQAVKAAKAHREITQLRNELVSLTNQVSFLSGVGGVSIPQDDQISLVQETKKEHEYLMSLKVQIEQTQRQVQVMMEILPAFSYLPSEDLVEKSAKAEKALLELVSLRENLKQAQDQVEQLSSRPQIEILSADLEEKASKTHKSLEVLYELRKELEQVQQDLEDTRKEKDSLEDELVSLEGEIGASLGGLDECPVCGNEVSV